MPHPLHMFYGNLVQLCKKSNLVIRSRCIFQFQCSASYHWNFTEITFMGTWNKFLEHMSTFTFESLNWFCKLTQSAHIRYFCEKSMIAHSALAMKDTFASRFASIQWILDSVEFLENSDKFWLNFQVLASICYLLVNSLLCSDYVKWDS